MVSQLALAEIGPPNYISPMTVRKLAADDVAAFRELRIEMCRSHPEAFGQTPDEVSVMTDEKLLEWMAPSDDYPEKFVLGEFDGDRLIGTVAFRREDSVKERHRGWIWSVYVLPEGRGKGISRNLMQMTIDESRRINGLELLTLVVAMPQTSARTLYTSLGFFTTGLILHGYKLPDGRYIDQEEMMLWLT